MTVFSVPFATLPHTGQVRRPDLADPDCRAALAGFALRGADGRTAAQTWARDTHDGMNAELRVDAETRLATLALADDTSRTAIDRQRHTLADTDPVKTVITSTAAADRARLDRSYFYLGLVTTLLLAFTEAKLLSQSVMSSGVFGLVPGKFWDDLFAWAFAALPLATGLRLRSRILLLASQARATAIETLNRRAKSLFVAWVVLSALIFGPHLISVADGAADIFAQRPAWGRATSDLLAELQTLLQQSSGLEVVALLGVSLLTASTVIGALLTNDREAHARACVEHVRDDETSLHCQTRIDTLIADQLQTDATATGRLRGLLAAIEADRAAFAGLVAGHVEALQLRGDLASRSAILDQVDTGGRVIDAGPLFARR